MNEKESPPHLSPVLQALWHAGKNDWEKAHQIAQSIISPEGSWVHAYLHRVEGDQANADYWYTRSGHPHPKITVEQEWEQIATILFGEGNS